MKIFTFRISDLFGNEIGFMTTLAKNETEACEKIDSVLQNLCAATLLK